jgi:hypothetical protein
MGRQTKLTRKKRDLFLKLMRKTGNVSMSAKAIGISRARLYEIKAEDPKLSIEWVDAVEESTDRMIEEARLRATKGRRKPVYHQGKIVGYVMERSDSLLMFLIKGRRPEYATERRELSGRDGGPIESKTTLSPALQAKLDEHYHQDAEE